MDLGLLIARLVLGLGLASHGAQKLFGWFGGYGLAGTGGFMEGLGFRPGKLFAFAAGFCELAGGLLAALGLFGPLGPALALIVMIVAMVAVHARNGFFVSGNGIEMPLVYATGFFALGVLGPGALSLDGPLGLLDRFSTATDYAVLGAGVILALITLATRRPVHKEAPASA